MRKIDYNNLYLVPDSVASAFIKRAKDFSVKSLRDYVWCIECEDWMADLCESENGEEITELERMIIDSVLKDASTLAHLEEI